MEQDIVIMKEDDLKSLEKLWQMCFPDAFKVNEKLLNEKIFGDTTLLRNGTLCIKEEDKMIGAIVTKAATKNEEANENTAWISALLILPGNQNQGYGSKLYQTVEKLLLDKEIETVFLGQDYNNFFSGIPNPSQEKIQFFKNLGFVINEDMHYDLESDVQKNKKIMTFNTAPFTDKFEVKPLEIDDTEPLLEFLQKEFPDRWLYETKEYLKSKEPNKYYNLLCEKNSGNVYGFCVIQLPKEGQTLSGLGPIGISESIRGHKNGEFIVQQSLLRLKSLGANQVCIDWTILKDFYGKFDFVPVRSYRGSYKQLK